MKNNMYYIKGDSSKGDEVIKLLEDKGGKNTCNFKGTDDLSVYFIDKNGRIRSSSEDHLSVIMMLCEKLELPGWEPQHGESVLVRNTDLQPWMEAIFSYMTQDKSMRPYATVGGGYWEQCIPFDIAKLGKV